MAQTGNQKDERHLRLWRVMSLTTGLGTVCVGLYYVILQIYHDVYNEVAGDPLFVFIIALNTVIASLFGYHFEERLENLIRAFNEQTADKAQKMVVSDAFRNIFNHLFAIPFAIGFAIFVASWVYFLEPWSLAGNAKLVDQLNWLLTIFLFSGNVMIGYGLYCIARFWWLSARRIKMIKLNIFNTTRPDIAIYQDITKRIVILVAVIATLAIASLPLSKIDVSVTAVLFSVCALGIVFATYLVPMLPLTTKFQETRVAELDRIEKKIDATYEQMIDAKIPAEHRAKMDEYTALREQVRKVKTLPPGGEFSIFTAVGVSLLTFLPTIFEQLLALASF